MVDFAYVTCPECARQFMAGQELFQLPEAYCHCPYCAHEFPVGVAAGQGAPPSPATPPRPHGM